MNSFDQRAQTWDENPIHINRSIAIAEKMEQVINLKEKQSALEYGAGTGDLSFLLKDSIKSITTMDSSREMVRVMSEKLAKMQITNVHPLVYDLEVADYSAKTFDLLFMQMVLHHVTDLHIFLTKCYHLLEASGTLAIADLYSEDGSFHGAGFNGHLGFDIDELSNLLLTIGFTNIQQEECYVMKKTIESGDTKEFPLFLLTATK